jgi:hypothetical protein
MSLLLALVGAEVAPPPVAETYSGGWPAWDLQPRKRREKWRQQLDELKAKPVPPAVVKALAEPVEIVEAPRLTATQQAYIDGVFAAIVRAKNEQERARKLAEVAQAEADALQAQMLLAQAIEAERVAKQQMMDFDLAFVAAVLIEA